MRFYILESGSKGNCTIVESNGNYIMIDDGISNKKLMTKLKQINIEKENIGALLVTHNHTDHIAGISSIDFNITYAGIQSGVDVPRENLLTPFEEYDINGFHITVVPTSHDAPGSIGFIIEDSKEKLVYITDTGYIYEKVVEMIVDADFYIMESNHNVRMQIESNRPQYLKKRIMGDEGHLSNIDSANYICDVIGSRTKQIILAHLSEDANSHDQALADYREVFEDRDFDFDYYDIRCADQKDTVIGGDK
jgi:phosphoribosyl 1,2-cyclic phosphodiesterase